MNGKWVFFSKDTGYKFVPYLGNFIVSNFNETRMKTSKFLKAGALAAVFGMSYLGFSVSNETEFIAGEEVTVRSLTITSAKACEEEQDGSIGLSGTCNFVGRCALSTDQHDCML